MDSVSGLCHAAGGSLEHWIVIFIIEGGFMVVIVLAWIGVLIQKKIQKNRLESSLEGQERRQENPLILPNESHNHEIDSYVLENGLGEKLISGYWLGKKLFRVK